MPQVHPGSFLLATALLSTDVLAEDQTITVVYVNVVEGRIYDQVLRIPRR